MKDIIDELNKRLTTMLEEEKKDMYYVAVRKSKEGREKNEPNQNLSKSMTRVLIDLHSKFIDDIDRQNDELYNECLEEVKENNPERTRMINTLDCLIDILNSDPLPPFTDFDKMRELFKYIGLNVNYQIVIFGTFVKSNASIDDGKCETIYLPNVTELLNYDYKHITTDEVQELLRHGTIEAFLADPEPTNPLGKEELLHRHIETIIDCSECQQACLKIDEVLRKEVANIQDDDFQILIDNMETLSFGDLAYRVIKQIKKAKNNLNGIKVLDIISGEDKKEEHSNKKEAKAAEENNDNNKERKQKEPSLKKQTNLNQTLREINRYFDLETLELKEGLSLDQIIYVLSLMYLGNVEDDKVETFLRKSAREFKQFHPYAIYNQGYDKFSYLGGDNPEIKEHLDMIEYILSDASIFICDDETYKSTKELVEEELKETMLIINGNYTFEIEEAKKLLNKREEMGK